MLLFLSIVIAFKMQIFKKNCMFNVMYRRRKEENNRITNVPQNNYKPKTSTTLT